jgi:LEA14-like dessication related protein
MGYLLMDNERGYWEEPKGLAAFWGLRTNILIMPVLKDPVVTLEDIRLRKVSLSSLDLDVAMRLQNPNPLGLTLRELPFTILCSCGHTDQQLVSGNTGRVKIAGNSATLLHIPATSQNAALIGALATFVTNGRVQVTIRGTAIVDAIIFGWSVPFEKTLPVTMEQVAGSLAREWGPDCLGMLFPFHDIFGRVLTE